MSNTNSDVITGFVAFMWNQYSVLVFWQNPVHFGFNRCTLWLATTLAIPHHTMIRMMYHGKSAY